MYSVFLSKLLILLKKKHHFYRTKVTDVGLATGFKVMLSRNKIDRASFKIKKKNKT